MNMEQVRRELAGRLGTIDGLRVTPYDARKIIPPAALFAVPDSYTYDDTYGRGADRFTQPVTVLVGRASESAARTALDEYVSGSGPRSIKAVLDDGPADPYETCDTVTVRSVEFGAIMVGAVTYLGATFTVDIYGSGS